jgi:CRP-like cAMP-binding protein
LKAEIMCTTSDARSQNGFLKSLPQADFDALRLHLRTVELAQGRVLQAFGKPTEQIYFPYDSVLARVLELDAGDSLAVAMIGRGSILGALAVTLNPPVRSGAVVIYPGAASTIEIDRLRQAAERSPSLHRILSRHGQSVLAQAQLAVSCKASHAVEARLARWLLEVQDMSGSERFTLTQDTMAQMIGARFNSVSIMVNSLEQDNYISCCRDEIKITDRDGLASTSCKCYWAIKEQHDSLMRHVEASLTGDQMEVGVPSTGGTGAARLKFKSS